MPDVTSTFMQILVRLAMTVGVGILGACALPGPPPPPTAAELAAVPTVLGSGTARLTCKTFDCSQTWHAARYNKAVLNLYQLGLWPELAQRVLASNFEWDLAYFYLARSAEGLGMAEAAVTYYKLAFASKTKCASFAASYCDDLDVASLTWQGLERLVPPDQRPTNRTLGLPDSSVSPSWKRPSTFSAMGDVRKDIEQANSAPLKKSDWETDAEFQSRKIDFLAKSRNPRGYRLSVQFTNPSNKRDHLVHYDVERGLITIALPKNSRSLFLEDVNGKQQVRWLHNSFIETDSVSREPRTYKASNKLGASVTVTEVRKTSFGVAVLNKASEGYSAKSGQVFTTPMEKDAARHLLVAGTIVFDVALENRLSQASNKPFVIDMSERDEPTFDRPFDLAIDRYALPVRLLSVRLLTDLGTVVLDASGSEINSPSLSK